MLRNTLGLWGAGHVWLIGGAGGGGGRERVVVGVGPECLI